jgi:cytochrome c-type biogenesis protein CcmH/NrfG
MDARRYDDATAAYRQRLAQKPDDAEAIAGYAAARKAAASAVGRRLASELDEIRAASKKANEGRESKAGAKA